MKINLGCGLIYKRGYVNVDAFNNTVADQIMSATFLTFEDNQASLIECTQVIEHLGAAKSLYALAECFRVLQPGGILLLETPDIEEAFRVFLRKGKSHRKYLMNWIFGLDTPGMTHRFAFPEELLTQMLQQTGFVQIKTVRQGKGSIQPVIRVTCQKPQEYKSYQLISWVRRALQEKGVVDLDNQVTALDQEQLLDQFRLYALQLTQGFDEQLLHQSIIDTAVYNPQMILVFLQEAIRSEILPASTVADQLDMLNTMVELNLPAILLHLLVQLPLDVGTQQQAFSTIQKLGKGTLEKLVVAGKSRSTVIKELRETRTQVSKVHNITCFSPATIQQVAANKFACAAKAFAKQHWSRAEALFQEALRLDRDSLLTTWNLARLCHIQEKLGLAKEYYEKTLHLAQRYKLPDRRRIISRVRREMQQQLISPRPEFSGPIFHPI
ncbi:MAG: methyltransferase domain-containing protein [Promethearchaeota archaeon]